MKILFWNINNNANAFNMIIDLLRRGDAFAFIGFCEFWEIEDRIKLPPDVANNYIIEKNFANRVGCIVAKGLSHTIIRSSNFYSIHEVNINGRNFSIANCHFLSQVKSELNALEFAKALWREIKEFIEQRHIDHNIILGDFNQPHHSDLFVSINGLNSQNYKHSAKHKTFQGRQFDIYYSPISGYYGDKSNGPAGSYYKQIGRQAQSWHLYDNIFVTKPVMNILQDSLCEIIKEINGVSLLKNEIIDTDISDHLPIQIGIQ